MMKDPLLAHANDNDDETVNLLDDSRHNNSRLLHRSRPKGVRLLQQTSVLDRHVMTNKSSVLLLFPWTWTYKLWWSLTSVSAMTSVFCVPYQVAFQNHDGLFNLLADRLDQLLTIVFVVDVLVNFNLAFYQDEILIHDRTAIAKHYAHGKLWIDLLGVLPYESILLALLGDSSNSTTGLYVSLLQLLHLVRLYRLQEVSQVLQYNARVSLLAFTLARNILLTVACTHLEACGMYFLARLQNFDGTTWLGPKVHSMSGFARYIVSLYFNIVTFCTVGYGDFAPSNAAERTLGSCFMLLNIVVAAFIIGSMTLLIVKGDERTGEYRDSLQTLHEYSNMHGFDESLTTTLKTQLRLEFNNREIADERVLQNFPSSLRRKILRRLYKTPLLQTQLMNGVRQQFVDAFLASCIVEIFSPGEEIVERGSILSDLFLLVGGVAEITTPGLEVSSRTEEEGHRQHETLEAGDFIGEIGFFTESPQVESVTCLTVCKTLTMSRSAYKLLSEDHPGSVGKILQNLLAKVEQKQMLLPRSLSILRAGSVFDMESGYGSMIPSVDFEMTEEDLSHRRQALTTVKDLVSMHMSKQLDDQTTKLLFAASRGDTSTISLMCEQGFDPDNADYDQRTALMVAAMKGNTDVVKLLLKYKANPNLADMHGSTALYEAVKNGHDATMNFLLEHGAALCMTDNLAASILCQAVFDGDILLLTRLLKAGIQVNAADYDGRTAAHIAAAEGNVSAIKVLARSGADLTLEDRWKNTVQREAKRSNARGLLEFLSNKDSL